MYYKYLNPERSNVIENLKIRFTQPSALNDPFEGAPLIKYDNNVFLLRTPTPENESKVAYNPRKSQSPVKSGQDLIDHLNYNLGILSLSRTRKNLLLWSHYADSHRGYVIGFDERHDFFKFNSEIGRCDPILVSYTSERPVINGPDETFWNEDNGFDPIVLAKILGHKPIDWAYEEEVRILQKLTMIPPSGCCQMNFDIILVDIPPTAISGIYLGANMNDDTQKKLIKTCTTKLFDIPIYKASLSDDSYSLKFNLFPM